jgi:hypothetical protein
VTRGTTNASPRSPLGMSLRCTRGIRSRGGGGRTGAGSYP